MTSFVIRIHWNINPIIQAEEGSVPGVFPGKYTKVNIGYIGWQDPRQDAVLPELNANTRPDCSIDIFSRGDRPFDFTMAASVPWIRLPAVNRR